MNRATDESQAEDYFRARADEVCTEAGYSDYEVVETSTSDQPRAVMVPNGKGGLAVQGGSFFRLSGHVRCERAPAPVVASTPAARPVSKPPAKRAGLPFNKLDRQAGRRFRGVADMYFDAGKRGLWLDVVSVTEDGGEPVSSDAREVVFVFEWRPNLATDATCDQLELLVDSEPFSTHPLERDGHKVLATLPLALFVSLADAAELDGRVCGQQILFTPEQQKQLRELAETLSEA